MPPQIEAWQVKGLNLSVLRTVMNGRGDAVPDLARSNLIR